MNPPVSRPLTYISKTFVQIRSRSQVLKVKRWAYLGGGGIIQPPIVRQGKGWGGGRFTKGKSARDGC